MLPDLEDPKSARALAPLSHCHRRSGTNPFTPQACGEDIMRQSRMRPRASSSASSCTFTGDDDGQIGEQSVVDLTVDDPASDQDEGPSEVEAAFLSLGKEADIIRVGDFIQVNNAMVGPYKVEFVLVKALLRTECHQPPSARGIPFARTRCMGGKLPKKLNEICMIQVFDDLRQQGPKLIDVPTASVDGKRSLIMTNALYPMHNPKQATFMDFGDLTTRMVAIEEHGILVCRWKLEVYELVSGRHHKLREEVFTRLSVEEIPDRRYAADEFAMRATWRGETIRGGSWVPNAPCQKRGEKKVTNAQRSQGQQYTLFDSFCGAGGVSRGADLAGFHVKYAVDKSSEVWETYRANFPFACLHKGSVDDFIKHAIHHETKVDVLHLSPPCQPFSPAHTRAAAHDDENIFALMGCFSLIKASRPRIVTLEQTFGITHDKHGEYMKVLINDFTSQGFSVRWRIIRLATWGSYQDRKRLIMIAAAPGERLPTLPKPSHSEDGTSGLKPFNTINKALNRVNIGDDLHDLENATRHEPPKVPYRGDRLLHTITTSPGAICHPSGTRDLTLREVASLQGFPKHHTFIGSRTSINRQIGNAFPPNTVRHLYKHIDKWLLEQDGMTPYLPQSSDIIDLEPIAAREQHSSWRQGLVGAARGSGVMEVCEQPAVMVDLT